MECAPHDLTLPTPLDLQTRYPLPNALQAFITSTRQQLNHILVGKDSRFLIIVGPCSIHDPIAAYEYAVKLRDLALRTPHLCLVMRTYFEKSRTAFDWKGLLYDPHLDGSNAIAAGLEKTRQLLLQLAALGVPTAAELLEPCAVPYFADLLSWACIGARTTTSQIHRQLASGLTMPVAFKNSLDGSIDCAIQSAAVAALPHHYLGINTHGHVSVVVTQGNPHTHIVLRGRRRGSNCDANSINRTLASLQEKALVPGLLVDCSHGNSQRQPDRQGAILHSLIDIIEQGQQGIRGALLESNLVHGSQPLYCKQKLTYGVSITDPCLSWPATEELLCAIDERLQKYSLQCSLKMISHTIYHK